MQQLSLAGAPGPRATLAAEVAAVDVVRFVGMCDAKAASASAYYAYIHLFVAGNLHSCEFTHIWLNKSKYGKRFVKNFKQIGS